MERHSRAALWSIEALADLADIWSYYCKTAGPDTAEKIVREMHEAARLLSEHPLAGKARHEIRPGLRSMPASPHVLFYRVQNNTPEIIRVLDGRRDVENIFSGS